MCVDSMHLRLMNGLLLEVISGGRRHCDEGRLWRIWVQIEDSLRFDMKMLKIWILT